MRHEHGIFAALLPDRNAHGAGGICAHNALAVRSAFGGDPYNLSQDPDPLQEMWIRIRVAKKNSTKIIRMDYFFEEITFLFNVT